MKDILLEVTIKEQFKNGIQESDILSLMKENLQDIRITEKDEAYVNIIKDVWAKELARQLQEEVKKNVEKK